MQTVDQIERAAGSPAAGVPMRIAILIRRKDMQLEGSAARRKDQQSRP